MRTVPAVAGMLILAACSGGGSSGGVTPAPTPSPTPSPTASPTPSPTPSPNYTTLLDLSVDRALKSSCTTLRSGIPATGPTTLPDQGLTFDYAVAGQSWTVRGASEPRIFTASDSIASAPPGWLGYEKTGVGRLEIGTVQAGGSALNYGGFAQLDAGASIHMCVTGASTPTNDFPSGASYGFPRTAFIGQAAVTGGSGSVGYDMSASTISFDLNLATRKVTTTIHFVGSALPVGSVPPVDFGTATGTANIDPATGSFYGDSWTSIDMQINTAQFGGRFYGPQAREVGYAITFDSSALPFDGTGLSVVGTVFAAR